MEELDPIQYDLVCMCAYWAALIKPGQQASYNNVCLNARIFIVLVSDQLSEHA